MVPVRWNWSSTSSQGALDELEVEGTRPSISPYLRQGRGNDDCYGTIDSPGSTEQGMVFEIKREQELAPRKKDAA